MDIVFSSKIQIRLPQNHYGKYKKIEQMKLSNYEITFSSFPTLMKALIALSRCSCLWPADS